MLARLQVARVLEAHRPTLAGTIPIGVDLPDSDLDVICEAHDLERFARLLASAYGTRPGFLVRRRLIGGLPAVVARFRAHGFHIEIFAQPRPAWRQNAVRHMQVERRLLRLGGRSAAQAVRRFKEQGLKTEPAFARVFGLEGDPYRRLAELSWLSEGDLVKALAQKPASCDAGAGPASAAAAGRPPRGWGLV